MEGAFPPEGDKPDEFDAADGFKAPKQVDLATIVSQDASDESLTKYKASLLGASAQVGAAVSDGETRRVVIHELRIAVAGRPDIVLALDTPERIAAVEGATLVVKEGLSFNTRLVFSVHRDVVLGLKFAQKVTRMGLTVDSMSQMVGSYPPKAERYEFAFPQGEWPSGLLGRGKYAAKTKISDDDGTVHAQFTWSFEVKKAWPDEE